MAVVFNLPLIVKIVFLPIFILEAVRRFIHFHFIVNICHVYHSVCRDVSRPFLSEIRQFLTSSSSKGPTALEYGSGPYPALEAYPPGTHLICVDPCPDFDAKLNEAWNNSHLASSGGKLTLITSKVEDIDASQIPDGSVDVALSRMANCSVSDPDATFKNIHRFLKPGGRYYFWDHVLSESGAMQIVQYLMSFPIVAFFSDCTLVRKPWERLKPAGFTDVKVNRFKTPLEGVIFQPYTATASGYGTK